MRDGEQLLLSLNGELQAQETIGDKAVNTLSVSISLTDPNAVATIDDVQLFDMALSPTDLAEAAVPLPGDAPSLSKGEAGVSSLTAEADANSVPSIVLFGADPPVALNGETTLVVSKYYYLNSLRVATSRDGVLSWIHSDHLHSATILTDAAGAELRRLAYRAFGEEAENIGSGSEPKYSYTGKELDSSGLMYYGARYYDPALSRFITPDTVYDGASPQGLNRYSYVLNNPILYIDPSGHAHWYQPYTDTVANAHAYVSTTLAQADEASGYNPVVMAINNVVTKTISDVAFGIVESGGGLIPLGEEIGEWVADPLDYNKIPVVGSIGKDLGESYANVYTEGANVENVLRAVAVTAEAVGTAFGAVKTPKAKAKQPAHKVSRSQYPNHTKMLENAQTQGHSLQNLKRGQGTRAAKKNRYQSQKDIRKRQGGPTDGYDYDEFPYASTEQGGAGAYVEPVPSAENQAAGRDLGIFYREQNVTYGDEFDVEITD